MKKGAVDEAVLNYRKAVICGLSGNHIFTMLRKGYRDGYITKEEYDVLYKNVYGSFTWSK